MSEFDFRAKPKAGPKAESRAEAEIVEESGLPAVQIFPTQPALLKLLEFEKASKELLAEAKKITIVQDDTTNERAITLASRMKKIRKRLEVIHHHFTDPHFQYKKVVDNFFNQYEDPLEAEEKALGRKSGSYRLLQEQERRRQEAEAKKQRDELQKKLDQEAADSKAAGKPFQAVTVVAPIVPATPKTIRTEEGAASLRHDWDFELLDINLVEDRFIIKTVDGKKVRDEAKGGLRESPGLRIFEKGTTNIRV